MANPEDLLGQAREIIQKQYGTAPQPAEVAPYEFKSLGPYETLPAPQPTKHIPSLRDVMFGGSEPMPSVQPTTRNLKEFYDQNFSVQGMKDTVKSGVESFRRLFTKDSQAPTFTPVVEKAPEPKTAGKGATGSWEPVPAAAKPTAPKPATPKVSDIAAKTAPPAATPAAQPAATETAEPQYQGVQEYFNRIGQQMRAQRAEAEALYHANEMQMAQDEFRKRFGVPFSPKYPGDSPFNYRDPSEVDAAQKRFAALDQTVPRTLSPEQFNSLMAAYTKSPEYAKEQEAMAALAASGKVYNPMAGAGPIEQIRGTERSTALPFEGEYRTQGEIDTVTGGRKKVGEPLTHGEAGVLAEHAARLADTSAKEKAAMERTGITEAGATARTKISESGATGREVLRQRGEKERLEYSTTHPAVAAEKETDYAKLYEEQGGEEVLGSYATWRAKFSAKPAKPTLQQFLDVARSKNPGKSDAELKAYYEKEYGK